MKQNRADSLTEQVKAAQASGRQISPPSNLPLTDEDMPFFASVIDEFARTEWTAHQLELAAILAWKMRLLREEMAALEKEGFVLKTERGAQCQNPRLGGVRMLDTSILSTRRSLSLHARAKGGETRDIAKRRETQKGAEIDADDELLARPN